MPNKYYDLPGARGRDNMGGFAVTAYLCSIDSFDTIKGFKTTDGPGDKVTIDGNHVWKEGKGVVKVKTTLATLKKMLEAVGERGGKSHKGTLEFFRPGTTKADAEFQRQAPNDEFIMFVKDPNTNQWLQCGSEDLPLEISGKYDSATVADGRKGFTYNGEWFALGLAFYEGTFTFDETSLSSGGPEDAESFIGG